MDHYKLSNLTTSSGDIYIKIKKGMYGFKQAAILAYENLITNLKPYCYEPIPHNTLVYDIKCDGKLMHPLHTECAQRYIVKRHTSCAMCRFPWLE